jgi:hypothetical protein
MSCVLRVNGKNFDVDSFLRSSTLTPLVIYRRGEPRFPGASTRLEESSGMNVSVSVREFSDLSGQIEDGIRFLAENAEELRRLRNYSGVESIEIDFPAEDRDVAVRSYSFPSELISLLGQLQIGLSVSAYPPSEKST